MPRDWLVKELGLLHHQLATVGRELRAAAAERAEWQRRAEGLADVLRMLPKRPKVGQHPRAVAAMRWVEEGPHDFWHPQPAWASRQDVSDIRRAMDHEPDVTP